MTTRRLARVAVVCALVLAASQHELRAEDGAPRPGSQSGGAPPAEVTSAEAPSGPLELGLADAIARGLDHNLAAVIAAAGVEAASGARTVALSGVRPALAAGLSAARQKINLEAYGLPVPAGESPLIGPFNVVGADISLSQPLFDVAAMERAHAGGERLLAATFALQDARDLVVVACAGLYLEAVASSSRVEAARAQVATAQALARRAGDMKQAGTIAGIEVLRANVQLATQRLRLIQAENELERTRLALARAIGLPLGEKFELVDTVPYAELATMSVEEALAQADAARPDLARAEALLRAAADEHKAAVAQAWPSLHLDADAGKLGPTAERALTVYSIAATVRIPLFDGGRTGGQNRQTRAALEQEQAQVADLRVGVEYEVRTALLDLAAASEQVQVATGARSLAEQQLAQAEDRFSAGVASNIEVVQAQQALAETTDSYISSLLAHNLAKLALARALGVAEPKAELYLGGGR